LDHHAADNHDDEGYRLKALGSPRMCYRSYIAMRARLPCPIAVNTGVSTDSLV